VGVLIARRSKGFCIIKCFSDLEVTKGNNYQKIQMFVLDCSARFKGILENNFLLVEL
jgi:hypothetical protein